MNVSSLVMNKPTEQVARHVSLRCLGARLLKALGLLVCQSFPADANDISILVYGGWLSSNDWQEAFAPMRLEFVNSQLIALAISQQAAWLSKAARTEMEGQVVRHFGIQDHWEFNALGIIRRTALPWEGMLDMSVAGGLGLSYATELPDAEIEFEGDTERLLVYWMLELEAAVPRIDDWHILTRLHHRSAAYGQFGDGGRANVLAVGLRHRF